MSAASLAIRRVKAAGKVEQAGIAADNSTFLLLDRFFRLWVGRLQG